MKLLVVALAATVFLLGTACGGGGGSDSSQIKDRVQSFVNHLNDGNAKAILDNDVPASARRTCSDKEAQDSLKSIKQFGLKLSVKSVDNVMVNGNKARATVAITTGNPLLPTIPPQPANFVKDGGAWRFDTTGSSSCGSLNPFTGLS